jgi:hypothetical protein
MSAAATVGRVGVALPGPPEPETLLVPGDDGLRLDEDQRRSPSGPDTRQHDPEPPVCLREPDSVRSGALQYVKLVPQGQDFKMKRRARKRQRSEGQQERAQRRDHGREAYPASSATSTAATRTAFSVGTSIPVSAVWNEGTIRSDDADFRLSGT